MRLEGRKLILGDRPCPQCEGTGRGGPRRVTCPKCEGTGAGLRGGRGTCRACLGLGHGWQRDDSLPCRRCEGRGILAETRYDWVPEEVMDQVAYRVFLRPGGPTWNEAYLGAGVASCVDCGVAWKALRAAEAEGPSALEEAKRRLIDDVRRACHRPQAVDITDDDGRLCDYIAVVVNSGGWSARPVYDGDLEAVMRAITSEQALGGAIAQLAL